MPAHEASTRLDDPASLFLGVSAAAVRIREEIVLAARGDTTVLITGESGVGKELVARGIHRISSRSARPFVALNCAAIPDALVESELFGHESGAFTDARVAHRGALEQADGGSLFLDEVGDLSPAAQPKLLRALETGEARRVGGEQAMRFDVRFLAATNHPLRRMSRDGRFRADLYYRLRVIEVHVPPLRERHDDILVLAEHFARRHSERAGRPFRGLAKASIPRLLAHAWPGNVRELRSVVERAGALAGAAPLEVRAGDLSVDTTDPRLPLGELLEQDWKTARARFETTYAAQLLDRHRGDVKQAARAAGLVPRSFYKMLHRLGLRPDAGSLAKARGGNG
jgi:DNA-binding NtrC family response regulator